MKETGDRLREIRVKKNLSLREAAEKVGISHTYLNALERGYEPRTGRPVNPSARTLVLIAKGYGIPLEELLRMASREGAEESDDLEAVARSLQTLEPEDREVVLYLIKRLHGG
ncbi:MAG: helix-turn-helix domain-containing protein [Bacteroidota bacterium]